MNPVATSQLNMLFSMNSVWLVAKLLYIVAFLVYIGFAIIVVSQVEQMAKTITTGFEAPLKLISWLHLGGAILALLWAFMIL